MQSSAPVDWNFPSPNATPTHGSFGSNIYQTPKTSSFPTHFQDAFATPQMPGYSTPQQMQYASMTPVQKPQNSSDTLRSNYYANIQAGGQNAVQSMQSHDQIDQSGAIVSPTYGGMYGAPVPSSNPLESMQMQTPPPTRGQSSRKTQQVQDIAFGTPSTIASRRFMTPNNQAVQANNGWMSQQSPVQFPQLQFSPEMYPFSNLGPASAPVMPQSRILWDQTASPIQPVTQPSLDDPFAPATSTSMTWSNAEVLSNGALSATFDTPAMSGFSVQAPHPKAVPARRMTDNFGSSTSNDASLNAVDPSLLYSGPARSVLRSNSTSTHARPPPPPPPHEQKKKDAAGHNRNSTISSTDTSTTRSSTNLQRSKTTGPAHSKSVLLTLSGTDALSRSNSVNQMPRTASPVKRIGRPSLGSASEGRPKQRTSVILTVDENGIARTETKRIEKSPARSIRERYPALFDSDSSDAESNASEQMPSRPSSFIFDKRDERRPKVARLDPPVENLEGLTIPRSGSSASMKRGVQPSRAVVAATAQLRRQGSQRRSTPSRNSRRNLTSSSTSSLIDTCPMDAPFEPQSTSGTNSIESITSLPQDNHHLWTSQPNDFDTIPSSAESALEIHNRRWSMMSMEQQLQRPILISPPQQNFQQLVFSSPPMPQQHSPPLQIRCQCAWSDDRGLPLVRCRSCTQVSLTMHVAYLTLILPKSHADSSAFSMFSIVMQPALVWMANLLRCLHVFFVRNHHPHGRLVDNLMSRDDEME